jgi:CheY-like chemotaxis protein/nitrogen-specific signal transduction histidine kinase
LRNATPASKKRGAKLPASSKPLISQSVRKKSRLSRARPSNTNASKTKSSNVTAAAIAAFAHEIRTPLTGILAISDMLATSDVPERERRWAETIKQGAEHLASLTTLFVDSARGGGRPALQREQFGLRALIRTIGDSLVGRATAKGLTADVAIESVPVVALGDGVRLRAALENLIDNAVKFTDRGGVALSAAAHLSESGQIALTVAISDSGIGLSLAEIRRLFRPFSQANLDIAARFGGAGLGLASVRKIARAMDGDVTVAARAGGGSVFTMTVILGSVGAALSTESVPLRPLRILCVEDNPFGRVVFKAVLTELGHHVTFIEQGAKAATAVAQGTFDVVLMDMVLPDIDGVAAIRQIRALAAPKGLVPVIGVSGRDRDRAAAISAGASAFAVKPVSPALLAELLSQATKTA